MIVTATDAGSGVPNGTAVALDVDLNNDGDFADTGETGYTSAVLNSGSATFDVSPALAEGTYKLRARNLQTPEEVGLQTLGADNTPTLTIVAR